MKDLEGTLIVQALSGSVIQSTNVSSQLIGGRKGQVTALRQVLSQQTVGVLVGAAFPCVVRMGEEDLNRQSAFEVDRTCKFTAVVQRKALTFGRRQRADGLF